LVIIDADDTRLKKHFANIITSDIIEQNSYKQIMATTKSFAAIAQCTYPG
jgi:hypothetical protein